MSDSEDEDFGGGFGSEEESDFEDDPFGKVDDDEGDGDSVGGYVPAPWGTAAGSLAVCISHCAASGASCCMRALA